MTATLRLATAADAPAIAAIYAPIVAETAISFETEPPDATEIAARIARTLPACPWLVATAGGDLLGYAYGGPHRARPAYRWSVEVSCYVAEAARGCGVGRRLYAALLALLRRQGYRVALGGIALPNPASVALHEAAGFRPAGVLRGVGWKLGRWHDLGWWQAELAPPAPDPAEPRPLAAADLEAVLDDGAR